MTHATSAGTSLEYGVQRVCKAFDIARSSYYDWRLRKAWDGTPGRLYQVPAKRGPKTEVMDGELLKQIREDLESSPFKGEGHRKVWARLKAVSYTHLRAHETVLDLVCRLLLEKKKNTPTHTS